MIFNRIFNYRIKLLGRGVKREFEQLEFAGWNSPPYLVQLAETLITLITLSLNTIGINCYRNREVIHRGRCNCYSILCIFFFLLDVLAIDFSLPFPTISRSKRNNNSQTLKHRIFFFFYSIQVLPSNVYSVTKFLRDFTFLYFPFRSFRK